MLLFMSENRDGLSAQNYSSGTDALILIVLLLFIIGAVWQRPQPVSEPLLTPVATKAGNTAVLAQVPPPRTNTQTPTHTATTTKTPIPTATPTHTATAAATATVTAPPPATPTPLFTAVPTNTPLPLPTPEDGISITVRVPILMYHYISTPPEDADEYRTDLSVLPENFRAQIAYLAENGYQSITFNDLSLALTNKKILPDKPVILTFDDGYIDNYENAFPILAEYGFRATFFIVTDFIDNEYSAYMTWGMIKEMSAAGHHIEPHSRTHPDLTGQEYDYLIWQILGPQETISYHTGITPRYFSYPSGRYDDAVIEVLQALDFWGAVTTYSGKVHNFDGRYKCSRLRVRNDTPLAEFIDLVQPEQ